MDLAEAIVYSSVWLALACFPAAALGRAWGQSPNPRSRQQLARQAWSFGCLAFWIHVVSAFGVFYQWSHGVALEETARQTRSATGVDSGTGLYLNYAFAALWTVEAAWWWWRPAGYLGRPLGLFLAVQGFFLFMIVNGAVIFVDGPRRWLGMALAAAALAAIVPSIVQERQLRR